MWNVRRLAAVLALVVGTVACREVVPLPDGAVGTWVTDDPRYAGCFFRLTPDTFVIGTREGAEPHTIREVFRTFEDDVDLYVVTYLADGSEDRFAFHLDPDARTLVRTSQPSLKWRKEASR